MSPMSTQQQWTRRIRYSDQQLRVSDADRNSVAELLGKHYADGRLDQAEFDERVGRAMGAKTRGDLAGLFDDRPETEAGASDPAGPAVPYRGGRHRGGILRPLLLVALVLFIANAAWHAAVSSLFFVGPAIWAVVVIAVVLLVARARRH
jgi:hypothetical protein